MNIFCKNEEFFSFHSNQSDTLFVWFGGINEPFFSRKFFDHSGFDCLYFKDQSYDWYTNGLSGSGLSKEDFIANLKDFASTYTYICFSGQSSGGYAALYYALHCDAKLCIPFAPQTRNFFSGQCGMTPQVRLENISDLYRHAERRPFVVVNLSRSEEAHTDEYEWHDHEQIRDFRKLDNVSIVIHPYDKHAVSFELKRNNILYSMIKSTIDCYRHFEDG